MIMYIKELIDIVEEGMKMPFSFFVNPKKRIYILYIFTSLIMAFYVYKKKKRENSFFYFLLPKKVWLGKSAKVDYLLLFFNSFIKLIFIAPLLIIGLYIAFYTNEFLMRSFGIKTFPVSKFTLLFLYTLTLTIVHDFASYVVHYLQHKIPVLWEFHKVHHSATELNPITQYRIHPLELIVNNLKAIIVIGLVAGIFDYLSVHRIDKLTFIGVNIFSFVFLTFGANLRHSHIKFTYFNFLEYFFISPFQHQIHHSDNPIHFDKNMGSKLAIWDWMFGTLVRSNEVSNIQYGLGNNQKDFSTFWQNIFSPFLNIFNKLISIFKTT